MKWDLVRRTWEQLGGKVKKRWARLTDDDLTAIAGKRDRLAGRLRERYGYSQEHAERELDAFARSLNTP